MWAKKNTSTTKKIINRGESMGAIGKTVMKFTLEFETKYLKPRNLIEQ